MILAIRISILVENNNKKETNLFSNHYIFFSRGRLLFVENK